MLKLTIEHNMRKLIAMIVLGILPLCANAQKFPTVQLRTNGLYYLAASPNVGLEIQTDMGVAWQFDYIGAWWNSFKTNRFWSNYAFQTEFRYYPSSRKQGLPYTGHHFGVYAQLATYDFELGGKGIMCRDLDKTFGVGLSYGYTLPLTPRLSIDFTGGIGFVQSRYQQYIPNADNSWYSKTNSGTFRGCLPTKLEVSLVWNLNNINPIVSKKTERIIYY